MKKLEEVIKESVGKKGKIEAVRQSDGYKGVVAIVFPWSKKEALLSEATKKTKELEGDAYQWVIEGYIFTSL